MTLKYRAGPTSHARARSLTPVSPRSTHKSHFPRHFEERTGILRHWLENFALRRFAPTEPSAPEAVFDLALMRFFAVTAAASNHSRPTALRDPRRAKTDGAAAANSIILPSFFTRWRRSRYSVSLLRTSINPFNDKSISDFSAAGEIVKYRGISREFWYL